MAAGVNETLLAYDIDGLAIVMRKRREIIMKSEFLQPRTKQIVAEELYLIEDKLIRMANRIRQGNI